jgi:chemotaxis protein CheZ
LNDLATADIPDAKERLNFVIDCSRAGQSMDVESIFPVVGNINNKSER